MTVYHFRNLTQTYVRGAAHLGLMRAIGETDPDSRFWYSGVDFVFRTSLGREDLESALLENWTLPNYFNLDDDKASYKDSLLGKPIKEIEALLSSSKPRDRAFREAYKQLKSDPEVVNLIKELRVKNQPAWAEYQYELMHKLYSNLRGIDRELFSTLYFKNPLFDTFHCTPLLTGDTKRYQASIADHGRVYLAARTTEVRRHEVYEWFEGQYTKPKRFWSNGGYTVLAPLEGEAYTHPLDTCYALAGLTFFRPSITRQANAYDMQVPNLLSWNDTFESSDPSYALLFPMWGSPKSLSEVRALYKGLRVSGKQDPKSYTAFRAAIAAKGFNREIDKFAVFAFLRRGMTYKKNESAARIRFLEYVKTATNRALPIEELAARSEELAIKAKYAKYEKGREFPPSVDSAIRKYSSTLAQFWSSPGPQGFQQVIRAFVACEKSQKSYAFFKFLGKVFPSSVVEACDDGSVEYRLARSLGSLDFGGKTLLDFWLPEMHGESLIFPPGRVTQDAWTPAECLIHILKRVYLDTGSLPLKGRTLWNQPQHPRIQLATVSDVMQFIAGNVDSQRMLELAQGFSRCEPPLPVQVKPCRIPNARFQTLREGLPLDRNNPDKVKLDLQILSDMTNAVALASRRASIMGRAPLLQEGRITPLYLAALIFPIY